MATITDPSQSPPQPDNAASEPISLSPRDWRAIQWLTPGIGIKRWCLIALLGLILAVAGAGLAFAYSSVELSLDVMTWVASRTDRLVDTESLGAVLLALGSILVAIGMRGTFRAVENAFSKESDGKGGYLEAALRKRRLEHGEMVVALGGGTGLSTMLRGLKAFTSNITAIVTMADDGGSSGILREHGILPPGDLRNCIAALAETEPQMTKLFQHRFAGMGPLKGHSLGNLIVAAMFEMTGSFEAAVRETSKVLAIRGAVLPSTLQDVRLGAELVGGVRIMGQTTVNKARDIEHVFLVPNNPIALPGVVQAIHDAQVILIGPGSLYTSIIPNLLVPEIGAAIKASSAPKIYVCNVMTQPNETLGYKASDHVRALIRHIGPGVITHVLVNTGRVQKEILEKYRGTGADFVEPDEAAISILGVKPIRGDFIDDTNLVRHHPLKLASAILRLVTHL